MVLKASQNISQFLHRGPERASLVEILHLIFDSEKIVPALRLAFRSEVAITKCYRIFVFFDPLTAILLAQNEFHGLGFLEIVLLSLLWTEEITALVHGDSLLTDVVEPRFIERPKQSLQNLFSIGVIL